MRQQIAHALHELPSRVTPKNAETPQFLPLDRSVTGKNAITGQEEILSHDFWQIRRPQPLCLNHGNGNESQVPISIKFQPRWEQVNEDVPRKCVRQNQRMAKTARDGMSFQGVKRLLGFVSSWRCVSGRLHDLFISSKPRFSRSLNPRFTESPTERSCSWTVPFLCLDPLGLVPWLNQQRNGAVQVERAE
jgi:hypothetical protein